MPQDNNPGRSRTAKDTGLSNLHNFVQNQIWLAVVALAVELTAWMQMLALTDHPARRWEPKRLRLRLFSVAARVTRHARRTHLRLSAHAPRSELIKTALARLAALPAPTSPAASRPTKGKDPSAGSVETGRHPRNGATLHARTHHQTRNPKSEPDQAKPSQARKIEARRYSCLK